MNIRNTIGILCALGAALAAGPAWAAQVADGDLTTFVPDTAAVAAEVNGNFGTLQGAINDNDTRLTALEALVETLQSRQETADATIAGLQSDLADAQGTIAALQAGLATETAARTGADAGFQAAIDAEAGARAGGDASLQAGLAAETAARASGDASLQTALENTGRDVDGLTSDVAALQAGVVPNLGAYLSVDQTDPIRPVVRVTGANLQVVNGLGFTNTVNGVGNLIVGYDEARTVGAAVCSDATWDNQIDCESHGGTWAQNHKSGSHTLVVGLQNGYSSWGGVVFGRGNAVNGPSADVTGGQFNVASGPYASVNGGEQNVAGGGSSSVTGGLENRAAASLSSVTGGWSNTASAIYSVVSAGYQRTAATRYDWAAGSLLELEPTAPGTALAP
jgi:hypothetical protein